MSLKKGSLEDVFLELSEAAEETETIESPAEEEVERE